jgi:hypothetical protein
MCWEKRHYLANQDCGNVVEGFHVLTQPRQCTECLPVVRLCRVRLLLLPATASRRV